MKRMHARAALLAAMLGSQALPAAAGELLVGNKSADTLWRLSLEDGRKLGEAPTAPGPHERVEEPVRIVLDLSGRLAPDAEEPAAVGVVRIAADAQKAPVLDVHQHPAEGRVAVHRAHRPDRAGACRRHRPEVY